MHCKIKNPEKQCEVDLNEWGDHCVVCGISGHRFTKRGTLNTVLANAGRAALEQFLPEFTSITTSRNGSTSITEARIDVELFSHAYASDHLLDGTIRHLVTKN